MISFLLIFKVEENGEDDDDESKMKTVKWQSREYFEGIILRNENLNKPSGLTLIANAPIQEATSLHLVAIISGRVVGTLLLDTTNELGVAQIKQVAVSSENRGQKVGLQLMAYAETVATEGGFSRIILNARDSAWQFYEKMAYLPFNDAYYNGTLLMQPYFKTIRQPASNFEVVA